MKTSKFLQVCIGVAIVLFAAAFLIRSVNPAQAAPTPEKFISEGTGTIGKYQVSFCTTANANCQMALIINTETGETANWFVKDGGNWQKDGSQLPANPFGK